jgi:hypothetical protein
MKISTVRRHASGVLFAMVCLILSVGLCIVAGPEPTGSRLSPTIGDSGEPESLCSLKVLAG